MTLAARKELFKSSRPMFRDMVADDVRWLWAAHKLEGKPEIDQSEFTEMVGQHLLG